MWKLLALVAPILAQAGVIEMDVSSKSFLPPSEIMKGSHRPEWDAASLLLVQEQAGELTLEAEEEEKKMVTQALRDY